MSDELHHSLNDSHVHKSTFQRLDQFPLEARGNDDQVDDLLNVLVFAASLGISINHARHNLEGAPSGINVLEELARQLPNLDEIEDDLNKLLAQFLPNRLGSKGRGVPIDLSDSPIMAASMPNMRERSVEASYSTSLSVFPKTSGDPRCLQVGPVVVIMRGV